MTGTVESEAAFTMQVRERDAEACVVCGSKDIHVTHIFSPKLWDTNPDFPENAVCLCAKHREAALKTHLKVEELIEHAGLEERPLPQQLHAVERYDRWGNVMLKDGRRARGELFFDEEARGWLERGGVLDSFTPFVKYPRTFTLPWSDVVGVGDRVLASVEPLKRGAVVVTEKMDGENVTLYRDFLHTRSVARIKHESRVWLDEFWESIRYDIPEDWRICGEYLFVTHTVAYDRLPSYFMGFSVWNERNICLSWEDTTSFFERIGVSQIPPIYVGPLDCDAIDAAWRAKGNPASEGYVIRSMGPIPMSDFRRLSAKFIRAGYEQSEPVKANIRSGAEFDTNSLA